MAAAASENTGHGGCLYKGEKRRKEKK